MKIMWEEVRRDWACGEMNANLYSSTKNGKIGATEFTIEDVTIPSGKTIFFPTFYGLCVCVYVCVCVCVAFEDVTVDDMEAISDCSWNVIVVLLL